MLLLVTTAARSAVSKQVTSEWACGSPLWEIRRHFPRLTEERRSRNHNLFVKPDLCAISMSALTTPGDFVPDPPELKNWSPGLIPSSCNGVDGGIP